MNTILFGELLMDAASITGLVVQQIPQDMRHCSTLLIIQVLQNKMNQLFHNFCNCPTGHFGAIDTIIQSSGDVYSCFECQSQPLTNIENHILITMNLPAPFLCLATSELLYVLNFK